VPSDVPPGLPSPTAYDTVPYISGARNASSVERLATMGRLLGLPTAPPEACRVLELGCGDGGNLIPMAVSFPGSEFLGIDLAQTAIARGLDAISELGFSNVRLVQGTFAGIDASYGAFDYIVVHGVYSWVPEPARNELLEVIRKRLRPAGIAFVSYNAMPGSHIRGVLREMMRMHTRDITDPAKKIEQARALLGLVARAPAEAGDVYRPLLQSEVGRALQASDYLVFHDDLAEIAQPFFFADFMAAAGRHGLKFVAEANFHQMSIESMPPEIAGPLAELGQRDLIAKEQYLDFMTCRSFRQTLLCHEEASVDRQVDTARVRQFRFSSDVRRSEAPRPDGIVQFVCSNESSLQTDSRVAIAALDEIGRQHPRSVAFDDLAAIAGVSGVDEAEALAEILFRAFSVGVLQFHVAEPAVVFEVGARPVASPWARYRADTGRVVTLYHETVGLDERACRVLALLDGRHTPAAVAAELGIDVADVGEDLERLAELALLVPNTEPPAPG
jgi:methyltransferase-like protein/SAM-dependent methyltransferase